MAPHRPFVRRRRPLDRPAADRWLLRHPPVRSQRSPAGPPGLAFKVANIQDDSFFRYDNSRPPEYLALPVRDDYRRHAFPGRNLFVNAFQQQFPLLLGHADFDWMNIQPEMSVLTQRDTLLEFAREQTASVEIEDVQSTSGGLRAVVRVDNLAGHNLPSGVRFRRLFIEFSVLDHDGNALWTSGRQQRLRHVCRLGGSLASRVQSARRPRIE